MSETTNAIEFVRYVLQKICMHQNDIHIEHIEDSKGTLLKIRTHEDDMGRVIGKSGQTISALRLLVKSMGAKTNQRITLKVEDHDSENFSEKD